MKKVIFLLDVAERVQFKSDFCKMLDVALGGSGSYIGSAPTFYRGNKIALNSMNGNGSIDSAQLAALLNQNGVETILTPAIHGDNESFIRQTLMAYKIEVIDYYLPRVHNPASQYAFSRYQAFAIAQSI